MQFFWLVSFQDFKRATDQVCDDVGSTHFTWLPW